MKVGYVRVSTVEQNEERQVLAMKEHGVDKVFVDKASGKNTKREKLDEMLRFVREGDVLYVSEFSRLARSTKDLLAIVEQLSAKGVNVISLKENFDTTTASGRMMLTVVAAIAQFEREIMLERQREGIAVAKAKGRYSKEPLSVPDDAWDAAYADYMARRLSKAGMCKVLGISRPTLNRILKEKGLFVYSDDLSGAAAASVKKAEEGKSNGEV